MGKTFEYVFVAVAALPALYGLTCWVRGTLNTLRTAKWARENHRAAWDGLPWLAKQLPWSGIEALITKGLISGPEVDRFRARDEYFEKALWAGILGSALLAAIGLVIKAIFDTFG